MLVAVVGAGLAGLVAARTVTAAGVDCVVLERAASPGGTTVLSSGWIWRYRDLATTAWAAPDGDRALQRLVFERLPEELQWLEREGVPPVARATANPLTEGVQVDPRQAVDALAAALPAGTLHCGTTVTDARWDGTGVTLVLDRAGEPGTLPADRVVFAGGGYAANLDRVAAECGAGDDARSSWLRRNAGTSDGTSIDACLALGGRRRDPDGECYARAMPLGIDPPPDGFSWLSQVYAAHATVIDAAGRVLERAVYDWSDTHTVWQLARGSGSGWFLVDRASLVRSTPYGTVEDCVARAAAAGGVVLVRCDGDLSSQLSSRGVHVSEAMAERLKATTYAVGVRPGLTHTTGGLLVDHGGRVAMDEGCPGRVAHSAGVEVGGIATGGYASGLAQALVLGRVAGASAAARSGA